MSTLLIGAPARATFPGENGLVAFVKFSSSPIDPALCCTDQTLVMNADGSGKRRLSDDAYGPTFSPDGRKIAFSRFFPTDHHDGHLSLYTMYVDRSYRRPLTHTRGYARDVSPAFSHDGRHVAFVRQRYGRSHIYVIGLGGRRRVRRLPHTAGAVGAEFSPDGRSIAFTRWASTRKGPTSRIYVMRANGRGIRRLTTGKTDGGSSYSPNGREVAFVRGDFGRTRIWVVRATGRGERQLTAPTFDPTNPTSTEPYGDSSPVFSPDGREIAFSRRFIPGNTSFDLTYSDVFVTTVTGGDERQLTHTDVGENSAPTSWQARP